MKQVAYDYDAQRWIEGDEAVTLRKAQLTDELDMLTGPQGAEYAKFISAPSLNAAIAECKAALKEFSLTRT